MTAYARLLMGLLALLAAVGAHPARADTGDIDAAARGVVRIALIAETPQGELRFVGHGTGFAVTPTMIVTNAHVVRDAIRYSDVSVLVIPSEGDERLGARLIDIDPGNDLALIELTGGTRLPALTLFSDFDIDGEDVFAVGYPGVVDRVLSANAREVIRSQPPIRSRGSISGLRNVRGTDMILHSADIAGGNSGGPLLDDCGRVVGVNSASTLSDTGEGEFYFAISNRVLLPFLRKNDVALASTAGACRSLADLDREEAEREQAEREEAEREQATRQAEAEQERDRIEADVAEERENAMAFAAVLLLLAAGGAAAAWQIGQKEDRRTLAYVIGGVAIVATAGSAYLFLTRPGASEVEARLAGSDDVAGLEDDSLPAIGDGSVICALDTGRSRVTGDPDEEIEFAWTGQGCVNGKTQYGRSAEGWARVFVPNGEAAVSINTFDPDKREFRMERYLLSRTVMRDLRETRQSYDPPSCNSPDAASRLGDMQGRVIDRLPDRPNERLVYRCQRKSGS
ncbi:S1 family peptidase [Pseudoblastomonas halimionae]|uniref:Trypsin-like serine protease n=1 Tax=Alteriqipengyuania halimionae TaxID=1926630 RepID=A0A6I4U492_9SPHN|nr:serine protease [Alteriqipengyuania halimionae]MXP09057.1 trypsin-like serine protease [Alteriqipengyuania halimionae]